MFERALASSWDERSRRGLTTLTSFGFQVLAVGVLLAVPLLRPVGLPLFRQLSPPVSLGRPLSEPRVMMNARASTAASSNSAQIILRTPSRIPRGIPADGGEALPEVGPPESYLPGVPGAGNLRGVPNLQIGGSNPVLPPARPVPVVAPLRISHMSEGNLIRKVQPDYPPLARSVRIQGQVVLEAVISKQGNIENLRLLSGHPMLVPAAIEAVRQWRYRPYILNNEPVEVETQITVNFSLAGN